MTAGVYTLGAGLVVWGNYGNYADERFLASVVAGAGTVAILRGSRRQGWGSGMSSRSPRAHSSRMCGRRSPYAPRTA